MDRTTFYAKSLAYICSFDLHLKHENGPFARHTYEFDGDGDARVYNALNETRTLGADAVKGRIRFLQQWVVYPGHAFAELRGRFTLLTHDGEVLESDYEGVFHPAARRRAADLQTKAFLSMRFETGSTKYKWLVQYQCVAFGRLALQNGTPALATFDVYAMTAPAERQERAAASE